MSTQDNLADLLKAQTLSVMPDATTSVKGISELATDAEVQTGTDTGRTLVPSSLSAWWTWVKTQAQTVAGALTFSANLTANGAHNTAPGHSGITPVANDLLIRSQADAIYGGQIYKAELSSDASVTGTTMQNISLTITLPAGQYQYWGNFLVQTVSTTAGINVQLLSGSGNFYAGSALTTWQVNGSPALRTQVGLNSYMAACPVDAPETYGGCQAGGLLTLAGTTTLTVQICQRSASDASHPAVMKTGSNMIFKRLT